MLRNFTSHRDFLDGLDGAPVEVDQWQMERLALIGLKNELFFYVPGVSKEQLGGLAQRRFDTLEAAVAAVVNGLPAGAPVAVVPEGPYVYARVEDQ
jgi:hypothetical protein